MEWENINPVEAMLGENGLVNKYGAELSRDWYDVFLVKRVGNDTDVSIRERKNLTGISYDVDETDVVTRIMPTGEDADGNILYLPELYIDSPNLNAYTHPKWIHLPVSEAKEVTDGDEPKSKAQCYAEMRKAAQAEFDAGCDLPTVTLKVDFVNCSDAEEYKQYAALTDIFLGDSVRVVARRIGVEVSMHIDYFTRAWQRPFRWPTAARARAAQRRRWPTSASSIPHRSPAAARTDRSVLCRSDEVTLWAHFRRPPTAAQRLAMRSTAPPLGARAAAAARVRARIRVRRRRNPAWA